MEIVQINIRLLLFINKCKFLHNIYFFNFLFKGCAFLNTCDCSREKKILNNSKIKNKNNRIKSIKN